MKYFKFSILVTFLGLIAALLWGGWYAFFLTLMLSILEITLSFDNAILNISVFNEMNKKWQQRFLTWGILIAVLITRFFLPILIVAIFSDLNMKEVVTLIIKDPTEYAIHIEQAKPAIQSFGGIFLLLVCLKFMFDQKRKVFWLGSLERAVNQLGKFRFSEIILSMIILFCVQFFVPTTQQLDIIIAGMLGIFLFVLLQGLLTFLNQSSSGIHRKGIVQFLYLEILDASFSLDGVMSAFAITQDIIIIMIGLSIGAIFVRSTTVYLAHHKTIKHYIYLEHGAHYAIGALATLMLLHVIMPVSEIIIGVTSMIIIGLSLFTSIRYNKKRNFFFLKR